MQMHVEDDHDHGVGWCAKIVFFILMAVLAGLIGLIVFENQGASDGELEFVIAIVLEFNVVYPQSTFRYLTRDSPSIYKDGSRRTVKKIIMTIISILSKNMTITTKNMTSLSYPTMSHIQKKRIQIQKKTMRLKI